jgi:hypothetical protein
VINTEAIGHLVNAVLVEEHGGDFSWHPQTVSIFIIGQKSQKTKKRSFFFCFLIAFFTQTLPIPYPNPTPP